MHIYILILNRICRERDGVWQAPDSRALFQSLREADGERQRA